MERLVVDAEGKIVIPLEITQKYGLRPGDEISLVETANGLLVRVSDAEAWAWAHRWWNSLTPPVGVEFSFWRLDRDMPTLYGNAHANRIGSRL
jgi:bifunctional DNA-binding transcriptional regulator/antitoxin component of YhaV-PrlF toxin-antitoxin module